MAPETSRMFHAAMDWKSLASMEKRAALIAAIKHFCNVVASSAPVNSPRESDWLANELKTSDGSRLTRAINSIEYARYVMDEFLASCKKQTSDLFALYASGSLAPNIEGLLLFQLVVLFMDHGQFFDSAKKAFGREKADYYGLGALGLTQRGLGIAGIRALE